MHITYYVWLVRDLFDFLLIYQVGVPVVFVFAVATFFALFVVNAPYGRYWRSSWGPSVRPRLAWVLMELPCVGVFTWTYFQGVRAGQLIPLLLFIAWQLHYVQRTFVYPALMYPRGTPMPVSVIGMGFAFNILNALLNGIALTHLNPGYSADWLVDPRFIIGVAIFSIGFTVNLHSDHILRGLRKADEGYKIPHGGFFRWISSPNYLGEIMEWCGWALATWSLAGGAFACFTIANLAPRAWAHHKWYRANFKEYPPTRKALIPGLI